ncbi:hypothetical protein CF140_08645 [Aeromonas sobria]|nr:hypothetical protein CF140_08645 [Aeromonas sobria]
MIRIICRLHIDANNFTFIFCMIIKLLNAIAKAIKIAHITKKTSVLSRAAYNYASLISNNVVSGENRRQAQKNLVQLIHGYHPATK